MPDDAYIAVDGSGLSRYNYVTAETMVAVLEQMYRDPRHREAFLATLPIAGKDGTISTRMRQTQAEGNAMAQDRIDRQRPRAVGIRADRGTVRCWSFSILANDFVIPSATINWIADHAVEILANFKR